MQFHALEDFENLASSFKAWGLSFKSQESSLMCQVSRIDSGENHDFAEELKKRCTQFHLFVGFVFQGYTNTDNPFGDAHLLENFVWQKVSLIPLYFELQDI